MSQNRDKTIKISAPSGADILYKSLVKRYRLLLMVLKTFLTNGPMMVNAAMTTTATNTRINAYSTIPWPFSLRANNLATTLLSKELFF